MYVLEYSNNDSAASLNSGPYTPAFSFAVGVLKGKKLLLHRGFMTCREVLIREIRRGVFSEGPYANNGLNKSCSVIVFRCNGKNLSAVQNSRQAMERGLKAVNIVEDLMGFKRTILHGPEQIDTSLPKYKPPGKHTLEPAIQAKDLLFLAIGDVRWFKAPQLVSLYALMFRLGQVIGVDNFETIDQIYDILEPKVNKHKLSNVSQFNDVMHFVYCYKGIRVITDKFDALFARRKQLYMWDAPRHSRGYHDHYDLGFDGITQLCDNDCKNYSLKRSFKKLLKESSTE